MRETGNGMKNNTVNEEVMALLMGRQMNKTNVYNNHDNAIFDEFGNYRFPTEYSLDEPNSASGSNQGIRYNLFGLH